MRWPRGLIAGLICCAGFARAEPSVPEVIDTLVRSAPELTATGSLGEEQLEEGAVWFVTMMLYELGVYLPESDDSGSVSVWCEPEGAGWLCRLAFGVAWSDAESSFVGTMILDPAPAEACREARIEVFGPYGAGCWVVRDQQIVLELFG